MLVAITGQANGRRFDGGPAEGFGLGGGDDGHVGGSEGGGHVLHMADKANVPVQPSPAIWAAATRRT